MMIYEIHGMGGLGSAGFSSGVLLCKEKELSEAIEALKKIHYAHFKRWINFMMEYIPSVPQDSKGVPKPYVRVEYETATEKARSKSIIEAIQRDAHLGVKGPFETKYNPGKRQNKK
jgi:hypothetical protein